MTMMTTSFSGIKNREEIRVSKFGGWGRNKGFWSEYLPMDGIDLKKSVPAVTLSVLTTAFCATLLKSTSFSEYWKRRENYGLLIQYL